MQKLSNFIAGEYVPPIAGRYLDNYNPATGQVYSLVPDSDVSDVERAVEAAKAAFPTWSKTSAAERSKILARVGDLIEARADELARAESLDQGKPVWLAAAMDIPRASHNMRFFAGEIRHWTEIATHTDEGALNYTVRHPLGVAGLISPWNLPLYLLTWKIAPALAAGCTVVAKPSEITPMTAYLLGSILKEAGLPPGVCNIVLGTGPKAGAALTAHRDVPVLSFTGGTETGRAIAVTAAPMFKRLSLELGGKNPNIIFEDADLDAAVAMSIRSSFLNQGEICLCGSRIFVHEKIYEAFLSRFKTETEKLAIGSPAEKNTFLGPLASQAHLEKVLSYVELARDEGGTVVSGGEPAARDGQLGAEPRGGYFMQPTILTNLPHSCRVLQEEIFGPVVTVTPFFREDEAVKLANDVKYGLSASVWTRDLSRAHRVAGQLEVGTVWVNTWLLRDLRVGFGGSKASGMGREGQGHSIEFFTETTNVCVKY